MIGEQIIMIESIDCNVLSIAKKIKRTIVTLCVSGARVHIILLFSGKTFTVPVSGSEEYCVFFR